MFKKLTPWIPALAWAALIFTVSSIPNLKATQDSTLQELINYTAHFFEYFILALLLYYAYSKTTAQSKAVPLYTGLTAFAYALSDELHQYFVPSRQADIKDIIIDAIGIITYLLLVGRLRKGSK